MTIIQLPIDPKFPRMRSVELYDEKERLAVIGRSVGEGYGSTGTYEEAALAAKSSLMALRGQSALLDIVLGEVRPSADDVRRECGK